MWRSSWDENNRDAVFIPSGVAHGFQTLAARTEVLYQMTDIYAPQLAGGLRWNDPALAISWPITEGIVISTGTPPIRTSTVGTLRQSWRLAKPAVLSRTRAADSAVLTP